MCVLLIGLANAKEITSTLNTVNFKSHTFMTDRLMDTTSSITIQNTSGSQTFTITGIFIQKLFQADCTTTYYDNHGNLYGVMWSDGINFNPSASTPLGASYLYSMLMNYLYEAATNGGPPATTPGNGAGTWCMQFGIIQGAPANYTTSTISTITTPSSTLSNVVTWTNSTNPTPIAITCNDSTQRCTANTTSTQAFPIS